MTVPMVVEEPCDGSEPITVYGYWTPCEVKLPVQCGIARATSRDRPGCDRGSAGFILWLTRTWPCCALPIAVSQRDGACVCVWARSTKRTCASAENGIRPEGMSASTANEYWKMRVFMECPFLAVIVPIKRNSRHETCHAGRFLFRPAAERPGVAGGRSRTAPSPRA